MQDRELMKQGNYTGISGIPNQDIAMWVGMGPIADRSHDILGASDQAIVTFRRLMHAAAKATGEGKTVFDHSTSTISLDQLKAWEEVVDKGTNWRILGVAPEEIQELQT
jgi:phthalate 4,5-dioxygenase oxygenase subunit